jgi:hypothetical protein
MNEHLKKSLPIAKSPLKKEKVESNHKKQKKLIPLSDDAFDEK